MLAARALLSFALLFAESGDIFQRVERILGETAAAELRRKQFSRVAERLGSIKDPAADRAEILAVIGAVAFLNGQMPEAAAAFRQSEKLRPLREDDRFTLAMALVKLGDDNQARAVIGKLVLEHAQNAVYWYWLGRIDYDERRYAEAVENLQKATALDAQSARAWDSLGLAWDMQGHSPQARQAFERAVALNRPLAQPSPWPPHNFGYLLFRMDELAAAETALRESLQYDSNLARTHYYLGRVLEKQGRDTEAINAYRSAVAGDAQSTDACYSLAMLYRKLHREKESAAMFGEFKKRREAAQHRK